MELPATSGGELSPAEEVEVNMKIRAKRIYTFVVPLPGGALKEVTMVTNMDNVLLEIRGLQDLVRFTPHNRNIISGRDQAARKRDKDDSLSLGIKTEMHKGVLHVTGVEERTRQAMEILDPKKPLPNKEFATIRADYIEDLDKLSKGLNPKCPTGSCKGELIRYYLEKILTKWDELDADASVSSAG